MVILFEAAWKLECMLHEVTRGFLYTIGTHITS
jgi:hypothetical protein